jgi:Zn-dependent M32 family carboxypeptidase
MKKYISIILSFIFIMSAQAFAQEEVKEIKKQTNVKMKQLVKELRADNKELSALADKYKEAKIKLKEAKKSKDGEAKNTARKEIKELRKQIDTILAEEDGEYKQLLEKVKGYSGKKKKSK